MQPFSMDSLKCVLVFVTFFTACYFIPYAGNLYLDAFMRLALFGSAYVIAIFTLNISEDIQAILRGIFSKLPFLKIK